MPNLKLIKIKAEMLARKIGNKFGVDVKMTDEEILLRQILHNNIDMIFDIGANTGQFGDLIYSLGYKGKMVSFEPLNDAYKILIDNCKKHKGWIAAERCGIGEEDGETEINVSGNSISSSILNITKRHTDSAPDSEYIGKKKVKIYKLDTIGDRYSGNSENIFLKIDTQGYEEKVLNGASNFINQVKGLLVETSLVKLYEGQILFKDIYGRITNMGFEMHGIEPAFVDKQSGRILQVDAIFFRP